MHITCSNIQQPPPNPKAMETRISLRPYLCKFSPTCKVITTYQLNEQKYDFNFIHHSFIVQETKRAAQLFKTLSNKAQHTYVYIIWMLYNTPLLIYPPTHKRIMQTFTAKYHKISNTTITNGIKELQHSCGILRNTKNPTQWIINPYMLFVAPNPLKGNTKCLKLNDNPSLNE